MSAKTDLQVEVYNDLKEEEYSFQGILRKKTKGAYDINIGGRPFINTDTDCYIVYRSILITKSLPKHFELSEGDKLCVCAANGIEPLKGDFLVIGPEENNIKASVDVSAGIQALFLLVIRK